jgi:Ca-activated chloride channel homolog
MHFARPEYLNLLWGVPALVVLYAWSLYDRRRRLRRLVSPALLPNLTADFSRAKTAVRSGLLVGFFACSILALARPQWGMRLETVRRRGVDIMVALDTSYSMRTEDVVTSRLEAAKREIRSLVDRLRGDRIGLACFAGSGMVECPLTLDYGAIGLFLDAVTTEIVPDPGTSLSAAILTSTSAFIAQERKYKVLIIVTDGEDLAGDVDAAVEKARIAGVVIYTIGVGTQQGMPIPVRDDKGAIIDYRKDQSGEVVISRLDERALATVASRTGGRYFRATGTDAELKDLYDDISGIEKKELDSRLLQNYEDRFQVPLAAAVLMLAAQLWMTDRRKPGSGWVAHMKASGTEPRP